MSKRADAFKLLQLVAILISLRFVGACEGNWIVTYSGGGIRATVGVIAINQALKETSLISNVRKFIGTSGGGWGLYMSVMSEVNKIDLVKSVLRSREFGKFPEFQEKMCDKTNIFATTPTQISDSCFGQWRFEIKELMNLVDGDLEIKYQDWLKLLSGKLPKCYPKVEFSVTEQVCNAYGLLSSENGKCLDHECTFGDKFICYPSKRKNKLKGYFASPENLRIGVHGGSVVRIGDVLTWTSSAWALVKLTGVPYFTMPLTSNLYLDKGEDDKGKGVEKRVVDSGLICNSPIQEIVTESNKVYFMFDFSAFDNGDKSRSIDGLKRCIDFHGIKKYQEMCGELTKEGGVKYGSCGVSDNLLFAYGFHNNNKFYYIPMRCADNRYFQTEFPTLTTLKYINHFKNSNHLLWSIQSLSKFYKIILQEISKL